MPWYRAATTDIAFRWTGEKLSDGDHMTIPKYTMVMDKAGEYIFTLLKDITLGKINSDLSSYDDAPAIQGTINTLSLAGSTNITLSNLDSKNRLFISDNYIAENGIYVTSSADPNGNLWQQVENVELQPYGTLCYEFDIDPRRNCPYLQFPNDIKTLIGNGITVKYIVTNGYSGNVAAKTIDTFYDKGTIDLIHSTGEKETVNLNSENFLIYNISGTVDGQDPEDIETAYRSYRREVCTFDTLVTLRDYMNAIYNFGSINNSLSNVIVTDRTNDIQSTYRIVDKDDGLLGYVDYLVKSQKSVSTKLSDVELYSKTENGESVPVNYKELGLHDDAYIDHTVEEDDMSAYDLKFYILKSGGLLNDISSFNKSFTVDNSSEVKLKIDAHIRNNKSILLSCQKIVQS